MKLKHKTGRFDRHGLQFQLYTMLVAFVAIILLVMAMVQYVTVKNMLEKDVKDSLRDTTQNISATYNTDAYMSTIRSVINSNQYVVRTFFEDGTILVDTNNLSVYIQWPDFPYTMEEISGILNQTPGYFYMEKTDSEGQRWEIYGQLLARYNGKREILLVAKNLQSMELQLRHQFINLVKVSVAILLGAFVLCWLLAKHYLRPIQEMTERANQLVMGDYSVEFPRGSYTELDSLSEVLDQSVEQFSSYEQMRRDMIGNLSHDMRTPLTMIKAYAEMIQTLSGDNPEKRNEHLNVIINQSDKLSEFVNASLDLNRLQSQKDILNRENFPLDDLVARMVERIQVMDQGAHEFHLFLDRNCIIKADKSRIEQIINNLVTNAMKYGNGIIEVRVTREEEGILLEIIDFGDGIPEDKLHMIWTRYYRVNPYDKDAGSTGVGLSIVKEIADLHRLEYGVESPEGKGAHFWFRFPKVS